MHFFKLKYIYYLSLLNVNVLSADKEKHDIADMV